MDDERKISLKTEEIEGLDELDQVFESTSSKHNQTQQLRVWEGHKLCVDPKNAESYEKEKFQVIFTVNNFITKLYIDSQHLKTNENLSNNRFQEIEERLLDQLLVGHDLLTRLRNLLTMEKTDAVMDHSLNRTRFFKMDDDTRFQEERKDLERKRAMEEKKVKVKWLNDIIESMTARYNNVVDLMNASIDYKFLDEFKVKTVKLGLKKSAYRKTKDVKDKNDDNIETALIIKSPIEILNSKIIDSEVKATYRIIGTDVTSYKTVYCYSCTLYGLYAEGKGSKKEKAKEDAAIEMIKVILNEQNDNTLSNRLEAFNEQEINELQNILKTKQNYAEFLEEVIQDEIY
ncbi:uncharacterized protein LOC126900216 isoform X2 [Daktulosphaira vitifoliae]|nr:uncharacterized protein LOC126900216 isoform X2 [Daktulosphaira vitifoliae]XP_050531704.1 uncharacterized protein LOC126900216 isoform X2 [Daktulosphaira vitifoliae]